MASARAGIAVAIACAGLACSLIVSTSGLVGSPPSGDAGPDAPTPQSDAAPEAAPDAAPVDPALVGWWKFDEGAGPIAKDSSGNGNDGTLQQAQWVGGKSGSALSFTGGSHLAVPDSPSLRAGSSGMTVAFWLYTDDVPNVDERIVARGNLWDVKMNTRYPQLTMQGVGYAAMRDALPLDQWHHVAFAWDGTTVKAYVDGAPEALGTNTFTSGKVASDSDGLVVGRTIDGQFPCTCRVDDLRIYARALSATEIAALAR
jgi:hypothetical protein